MPREVRDHLFEPYFTTKGDRGGSGLGLARSTPSSSRRAARSGWTPGRAAGRPSAILVPETAGTPQPGRARPVPPGGPAAASAWPSIEDDTTVRALATTVLSRAGYRLTVKADAREAATLDPERLDLLLTDVVMPHIDGPGLAARLRAVRPDLPVLFMSGYTDRGGMADMAGLTSRPCSRSRSGPSELLAAVRRALDEPG